MTLKDLEVLLKKHNLKCAMGWYYHNARHWSCTVTDQVGYAFTGRGDHIEQAVMLAVSAFLESYRPIQYKVAE